ncbi:MAG: type II 3-dehydroquinate dehydratase [Alphaproteobacteria bacterium]
MSTTIVILNGPNLNLLGTREPEIYGTATLADIEELCVAEAKKHGLAVVFRQSNHEGRADRLDSGRQELGERDHHQCRRVYAHVGGDPRCAESAALPVIEVHLSDPKKREPFRHTSLIEPVAERSIVGKARKATWKRSRRWPSLLNAPGSVS